MWYHSDCISMSIESFRTGRSGLPLGVYPYTYCQTVYTLPSAVHANVKTNYTKNLHVIIKLTRKFDITQPIAHLVLEA